LAVAVINGTIGLEAALMFRRPVFVFAPALYQAGGCFLKPESFEEFGRQILEIRSGRYMFDEEGLYAVLQAIDDCVGRAPVDLTKSRSWTETALLGVPIYREFLVRQLKARPTSSATHLTEALHR